MTERRIVGFLQEDTDGWVAELSCGHRRHLHDGPPSERRPWVLDESGRSSHLGSWIDCTLCADEAEGGEVVCYAALVCPECGAVLDDTHRDH